MSPYLSERRAGNITRIEIKALCNLSYALHGFKETGFHSPNKTLILCLTPPKKKLTKKSKNLTDLTSSILKNKEKEKCNMQCSNNRHIALCIQGLPVFLLVITNHIFIMAHSSIWSARMRKKYKHGILGSPFCLANLAEIEPCYFLCHFSAENVICTAFIWPKWRAM